MTIAQKFSFFVASTVVTCLTSGLLFPSNANAIDLEPLGAPVCFGFSGSTVSIGGAEEVDGSPGVELLIADRTGRIDLDSDIDGLATGTQFLRLKVRDGDGSVLWANTYGLNSNEVFSATQFASALQVGTFFDPTGILDFQYIPSAAVCEGVSVLDAGGQKVIAVTVGTVAPSGDITSGTDLTKFNVWILNATTGATIAVHPIRPRNGRYVLINESQFIDYDGDGDDELVVVWGDPRPAVGDTQTFDLLVVSFNLTTKATEENFRLFPKATFQNANAP